MCRSITDFKGIAGCTVELVNLIIPVLLSLALLIFFIGLARFILKAEDENERKRGYATMFWGIIGLFVAFSLYGILRILLSTFGIPS